MRASILNTFIGALGFSATAASGPALSSAPEDCAPLSTETVFVTVPASTVEPLTVYVTAPASYLEVSLSEAPTTTVTRFATLYSTTTSPLTFFETISPAPSSAVGEFNDPDYSTITETAVFTITNVNLTPLLSGGSITYTETPAPNGILYYVVENGTTYWLDGQTPAPSESYVYATSTATVIPVDPTMWSSEHATSTLTLHRTIFSTQQLTLTETLESSTSTVRVGPVSSVPVGTGLPYSKPSGGWNATKTSNNGGVFSGITAISAASTGAGILATGATNTISAASTSTGDPATGDISLVLYPTFDIYQTSRPSISISSFAAQSGFNAFSTPVSFLPTNSSSDSAFATSCSSGELTSAVIDGQTVTWGGSSVTANTEPCTETAYLASTRAPYGNSSSATSSVSDPASATSLSSSELTTAIIDGQTVTWSGSTKTDTTEICTETPHPTSTGVSHANSTFATFAQVTSHAFGAETSGTSVSSSSANGYSLVLANSTVSANAASGFLSLLSTVLGSSTSSSATASSTANASSASSRTVTSPNSSSNGISSTSSASTLSALTSSTSSQPSSLSSSSSKPASPSSSTLVTSTSSAVSSSPVASSVSSSKASTSVSSTASAAPSLCGEHGDFLLNFDDIPPLSIGNQNPNTVTPEPVFNPYHQFDFSDGFVVVPPPTDPYLPSSPPLLLEFIPNFNVNGTNTQAGPNTAEEGYSGQISDGDGDRTGCFHFNVYGASFGCDSQGPPCVFTFSGYQLDASRKEVQIATQSVPVPACPALANCTLSLVTLDSSFEDLAFVRINVTVAQQPKIWWMDDLRLGWYNNSCTTGLCRQTTHLN